jgi:iron-sulfur cluster repair protein YtfE (RIC family)
MDTTFRHAAQAQAAAHSSAAVHAPERYNLYLGIHKALRGFMCDTLTRVGRVDAADADELAATLAQLDTLLLLCTAHIEHENDFLHSAIEARQPAGSARTASEHVEHFESIAMLRAQSDALAVAPAGARAVLALRLYRQLALFVAENFEHMHIEETANAATLWAHYSDAELHAIHDRLLATLAPQQHLLVARWMVPAMNPAERAGLFGAMKTRTPPEALLGMLAHVQPHLDASGWLKLSRAVGVPQVPGLVNLT